MVSEFSLKKKQKKWSLCYILKFKFAIFLQIVLQIKYPGSRTTMLIIPWITPITCPFSHCTLGLYHLCHFLSVSLFVHPNPLPPLNLIYNIPSTFQISGKMESHSIIIVSIGNQNSHKIEKNYLNLYLVLCI